MLGQGKQGFAVWKAGVAVIALLLASMLAYGAFQSPSLLGDGQLGALGGTFTPEEQFGSTRRRIDTLTPDSVLASAGAKAGDAFELHTPAQFGRAFEGEAVALTLYSSNGAVRSVTVRLGRSELPLLTALQSMAMAFVTVNLMLGLAVGLKRPESKACRALAIYFLAIAASGVNTLNTGGATALLLAAMSAASIPLAWGALAYFSVHYPFDAPAGLRRKLYRWRVPIAAMLLALFVILLLSGVQHRFIPFARIVVAAVLLLSTLVTLAALVDGWRSSKGELRQRQLWILASFGLLVVLAQVLFMLPKQLVALYYLCMFPVAMLCYAGLIYATFRFRVLSFTFAVNRVLLYSLTSVVLLIAFGLTEWLAIHFLHFESRKQSALLDAGIALGVYLAFHKVRHFIEHSMERLLFHRWHANEAALRQFVERASHFINREALLAAFGHELDRFSRGAGYAIYQRDHAANGFLLSEHTMPGMPGRVDVDDGIAVWLRTKKAPALIRDTGSTLPGELALPMAHRSELDGFILMGSKHDQEAYRPDELHSLGFAAHKVGLDLHAARVEQLEQRCSLAEHEARLLAAQLQMALRGVPAAAEG